MGEELHMLREQCVLLLLLDTMASTGCGAPHSPLCGLPPSPSQTHRPYAGEQGGNTGEAVDGFRRQDQVIAARQAFCL